MDNPSTLPEPKTGEQLPTCGDRSAAACCVSLFWNPGPAQGGGGTSGIRDGVPWWWDGDLLLVVVETNGGPFVRMVKVNADGDQLGFWDPDTGDDNFGYSAEDIMWWAKIEESLPRKGKAS